MSKSRFINVGLNSYDSSLQLNSSGAVGSRQVNYVKNAKRDSVFLANEMHQMNGLMSDIRQTKKYEKEIKRRYTVEDVDEEDAQASTGF